MKRPRVEHHGYKPGPFVAAEIESVSIAAWSPEVEPGGQVTQVHLTLNVRGLDVPLVLRFKGPETLARLIAQLTEYRDHVWPHAAAPKPEA